MKELNFEQVKEYFKSKEFNKEKDMCDYIEDNIDIFCEEVLNTKYISHQRESYLDKAVKLQPNKPHVDFFIETENKEYIIVECKNPINVYRENVLAIGQILDYIRVAENNGFKIKEAWICTSRIKEGICETINKFNLPIKVCLLNKKYNAVLKGSDNNDKMERKTS